MKELINVGDTGAKHPEAWKQLGDTWTLMVRTPALTQAFTLADLKAMAAEDVAMRIECVSAGFIAGGRQMEAVFSGIRMARFIQRLALPDTIQTVIFRSRADAWGGPAGEKHETALDFEYCLDPNVLLAWGMNGAELPFRNGGPLRSTVGPDRYFYKSMKWLAELEFTSRPLDECRGTWETYGGYHNIGRTGQDPEERFEPLMRWITEAGPNGKDTTVIVPQQRWAETFERAYAEGDLSRLVLSKAELMGFDLDRDFRQVRFVDGLFHAKIRGTIFRGIDFSGVDFQKVNLSLSKFPRCRFSNDGAQAANLSNCDMEGADFQQSDLTGVSMQGAWLTGTQFYHPKYVEAGHRPPVAKVRGLDLRGSQNLDAQQAIWLAEDGAIR